MGLMGESVRKLATRAALLVAGVLCLSQPLRAADRYVQATIGSDTSDCSSAATPCQTISYAVTQSVCGDTINIHGDETYLETVTVALACGPGSELTFRDWPGTGYPRIASPTGAGMQLVGAYIIVQGIDFDSNLGEGIDALGVDNLTVQNCAFLNNGAAGIQSIGGGGNDWLIQWSYFDGNGDNAIMFTGDNVTIDGNTIYNNGANQSIYIAPGATGVFNITNNFVTDGLDILQPAVEIAGGSGTGCLIENNRVMHNGLHGILTRQPICHDREQSRSRQWRIRNRGRRG